MYVFEDVPDFVNKTTTAGADRNLHPNINAIIEAYFNLSKGCGCSRAARTTVVNNLYQTLNQKLTEVESLWLKTTFISNEIVAKFNGAEVWKI